MRRMSLLLCLLGAFLVASSAAQSPPAAGPVVPPQATVAGGLVHGTVKSGNIPLPGVSIVASNTLTGRRYATVTDINGNYSMTIPVSGRYVLKTELAAFAPETKVALLKPTGSSPVNQQADFALTLASRVPPETTQESVAGNRSPGQGGARPTGTVRRNTGGGAQNLDLLTALAGATDAGVNSGATGATLPSLATSADFSTDSVAVTGQAGTTNPFEEWIWNNFARTQNWTSLLAARVVLAADREAVDPVAVDPVEVVVLAAVVLAVEAAVLAAVGGVEEAVVVAAVVEAAVSAVDSATSATLRKISPTALSSGLAETAR